MSWNTRNYYTKDVFIKTYLEGVFKTPWKLKDVCWVEPKLSLPTKV